MNRLVALGIAGLLVLVAVLDVVSVGGTTAGPGLALSFTLAAATTVAILARRRLAPAQLQHLGLALAAGSLGLTAVMRARTDDADPTWGLLEATVLALLLGVLTRRWARPWHSLSLLALAAAIITGPWRTTGNDAAVFSLLCALAVAAVLAVGLLRRADDLRAADALLQVRNDERRDIARDLHDDIAHHVTGIIVAAQAAALAVDHRPELVRQALADIERTGVDALESMRFLVSTLREPAEDEAAPLQAACWPADLQELVDRFAATTGLASTLTLPPGRVPTAHRQATLRVVQEALTNVRRHARGATRVDVVVTLEGGGLRVSVRDDGHPSTGDWPGLIAPGGGFGLVGLRERAAALGGRVHAGHREPRGWELDVTLPLARHGQQRL